MLVPLSSASGPAAISTSDLLPSPADHALHARAMARAAAGLVLTVGAAFVVAASVSREWFARDVFVGTWLAAGGLWAGLRVLGPQLSRHLVFGRAGARDGWFQRSWMLLSIGFALMVPLTMQLAFAVTVDESARTFDDWVGMSAILVGHVHIALAWMMAARAVKLARGQQARSIAGVYALTLVWSLFPGVLMFFIPVAVVAVTGLVFVPIMLVTQTAIERERALRVARQAA